MIDELEAAIARLLLQFPGGPFGIAVETQGPSMHGLFPSEAEIVAMAVDRRRREFAAGRRCARRALAALDAPRTPILAGRFRQPLWPLGYSGSIAHDGRFAAAVAMHSPDSVFRIGIDLIDRRELDEFRGVLDSIRNPAEPWTDDPRAAARLFAAKEVAIKIVSPAVQDLIDFQDFIVRSCGERVSAVSSRWPHPIDIRFEEIDGVIVAVGLSASSP